MIDVGGTDGTSSSSGVVVAVTGGTITSSTFIALGVVDSLPSPPNENHRREDVVVDKDLSTWNLWLNGGSGSTCIVDDDNEAACMVVVVRRFRC